MNESKIFRAICSDSWYSECLSEYLSSVCVDVDNIRNAIYQCISPELSEMDTVDSYVDDIIYNIGYSRESFITLPDLGNSRVNLFDYLKGIVSGSLSESDEVFDQTITSVESVADFLQETYSSTIIAKEFFTNLKPNVSVQDIVTHFQTSVSTMLGGARDKYSDTVQYYTNLVRTVDGHIGQAINKFVDDTGITQSAETPSSSQYDFSNASIAGITGANPGWALDMSASKKVLSVAGNVIAGTVKGVFSAVSSAVEAVFGKVAKYVNETVIDPAVANYLDTDINEGYIEGYSFVHNGLVNSDYGNLGSIGFEHLLSWWTANADATAGDKFIKLKTVFGEALFSLSTDLQFKMALRPCAIDVDYVANQTGNAIYYVPERQEPSGGGTLNWGSWQEYYQWITGITPYIRPVSKDADKYALTRGFRASLLLLSGSVVAALMELNERFEFTGEKHIVANPTWGPLSRGTMGQLPRSTDAHQITNASLLKAVGGYDYSNANLTHQWKYSDTDGFTQYSGKSSYSSVLATMNDILCIFIAQQMDRKNNPTNYTFIPYSSNHSNLTPGNWEIYTDSAIRARKEQFLGQAVALAIAITVVVVVGVAARKITNSLIRAQSRNLQLAQRAVIRKQPLTTKQQRALNRAAGKASVAKKLFPGLASTLSNDPSITSQFEMMANLIMG